MNAIVDFALKRPIAFSALFLTAGLAASYLLALAGDPRPLWIWRDLLGLM